MKPQPSEPTPTPASAPPKTLVVNANRYFAGLLATFLEKAGHRVETATTPELAVAQTQAFKPDFILLNNELDDQPALPLIPEILIEHPAAALILMAPEPNIAEAVQAIKQGATDYLAGPLQPDALIKLLRDSNP